MYDSKLMTSASTRVFRRGRVLRLFPTWSKIQVTHGNLTSFKWVVLRTAPKKNKLCRCVVSTRWCYSAHCKRVNDHCSKHVSRAPHFPFQRRSVAPSLSRSFNVWFFSLGYLKSRVYTHKPRTLNDLKEAIRQEIRPIDRQLLARVMDDFKKKAWKLHPRRRSTSCRYHF